MRESAAHPPTPRGKVAIRPATEADAAALGELRLAALRDHPEAFSAAYEMHANKAAEFWIDWLRERSGDQVGTIQIAVADDAIVGMTGLHRGRPPKGHHSGVIWGVYVRPEWRGSRMADRLIDACIGWARSRGMRIVKLSVVVSNTAAIRSYARCGFSVYGLEPQSIYHDGVYHDQLLMARKV
jgi:RimJ/RimL family protein N-acetyltransferase